MNANQYLNQSKRTAPKFEDGLNISHYVVKNLKNTISEMIKSGSKLDDIKKFVYYQKPADWIVDEGRIGNNTDKQIDVMSQKEADVIHAIVGMSTESVELLESLDVFLSGGKLDEINVLEEIGDTLWYIALLLRAMNTNFEDTFDININKLYKRFPDKFDSDKAINRNVDIERKKMEEDFKNNN